MQDSVRQDESRSHQPHRYYDDGGGSGGAQQYQGSNPRPSFERQRPSQPQLQGLPPNLQPINTHLRPNGGGPTSSTAGPPSASSSTASNSPRLGQPISFSSMSQGSAHSHSHSHSHSHHSNHSNQSLTDWRQQQDAVGKSNRVPSSPRGSLGDHARPSHDERSHGEAYQQQSTSSQRPQQHDGSSTDQGTSKSSARPKTERRGTTSRCAKCALPMSGQFVRALGGVYHLDCFRCQDCQKVVASKFFPVDEADGSDKQYPLCETDYFRRLNLLCAKCGLALRGSYITALDRKFHVEHFTCSLCPTVFGPQDSYYEHEGTVYCHFHYSTRLAVKCTGCRTAILKQFVEINRNSTDEHWHPECYMIHKFWNVKLAQISSHSNRASLASPNIGADRDDPGEGGDEVPVEEPDYVLQEKTETPESLKERQRHVEEQVYRIWTILSAFEESSAACISEMLRHVSSGKYVDGVRMAEKFVLHVETLFAAIDDLIVQSRKCGAADISHVREARMLCKKIVNFFSLLSHTHETGARKMSITQDLLSLVTGLAHYLKILIRIALTAALKLDREHSYKSAISHFLNRLDRLARDPDAARFPAIPAGAAATPQHSSSSNGDGSKPKKGSGYKSLTRAVGTLIGQGEATTDLCEGCKQTTEDECARFGTSVRWHLGCLRCTQCSALATKERDPPPGKDGGLRDVYLKDFKLDPVVDEERGTTRFKGGKPYCSSCAPDSARPGFDHVTRLEQYAFLLCVALNKLYALLKQQGVLSSPSPNGKGREDQGIPLYDAYKDSADFKRMKSVHLDRKTSTTARMPKRSMVIQSPSGRVATSADQGVPKPPVPSRKDQPVIDPSSGKILRQQQPQMHFRPQEDPSRPSRPGLARGLTTVEVVDEQMQDDSPEQLEHTYTNSPARDTDAITLADLPLVMEAEQAREQHGGVAGRAGTLLSELSALEYFIVKHMAALMLSSDTSPVRDIVSFDDLLDMIDARKNTFWGKLFKGGNDKKAVKKKGVFGIPLDALIERNGVDSIHCAGAGTVRIPSFVDDCISAMKQMDMSVEGIFRKNGNIKRLRELCETLDRDPDGVNLADDNPVQLAALLKRFLRDMPDPLLTFKLFQLFLATQRIQDLEERKHTLHLVSCLMPKVHRDTMEVLFVFLKWVASFSHVDEETGSKMDMHNLATVICPSILYSGGKDPHKDDSFLAVGTVRELLEHQDEFWLVPDEFTAILHDQDLFANPSLTSKEILARAEVYVKGNQRAQPPMRGFSQQPHRASEVQGFGQNRPLSFSTGGPHGGGGPQSPPPRAPLRSPPPGGPNPYQRMGDDYMSGMNQMRAPEGPRGEGGPPPRAADGGPPPMQLIEQLRGP